MCASKGPTGIHRPVGGGADAFRPKPLQREGGNSELNAGAPQNHPLGNTMGKRPNRSRPIWWAPHFIDAPTALKWSATRNPLRWASDPRAAFLPALISNLFSERNRPRPSQNESPRAVNRPCPGLIPQRRFPRTQALRKRAAAQCGNVAAPRDPAPPAGGRGSPRSLP